MSESIYFDQDHAMFRQALRRFVEREINPYAEEWDHARRFPARTLFPKLGALGALGPSYPEEFGGGGLDYWYNVIVAEELGRAACGGVPMAVAVHTDMATPALAEHGSDDLRRRFLVPALAGKLISAIAISEPDAGSDVAGLRTRAERDGDEYVINGNKMWITNGAQADFVVLLARTSAEGGSRGMSLIVVPTDTPGFSVSKTLEKLGNHCSDTALLAFDDVRVPVENRIGPEGRGFVLQMQQFQKERLAASISAVSGMERALELTRDYCAGRMAFGRPLLANQWIQFKLAELSVEVEALRQLNYHCVRLLLAGRDFTREASMAKLKAGRLSREVADTCVQFHGGMGYVEEYPLARYFRDSRLLSIAGGADEIMLGIIAKTEGFMP